MYKFIVAGCGTDVGKTVVSAILVTLLKGDYWKPIQCGEAQNSDTSRVKALVDPLHSHFFSSTYTLKAPLSPHHAARLEGKTISPQSIVLPKTNRHLIIESSGGIFVPLTPNTLSFDLFKTWNAHWVIVSRHYVGSINHTLLTLAALKQHNIPVVGLIFNGEPNPDSESAILTLSKVPFLGRLLPEHTINFQTIQRYAKQWHPRFTHLI